MTTEPTPDLRTALDNALLGMVRTSWPMDRNAEEKGWNEAIHAAREKVRGILTERPKPDAEVLRTAAVMVPTALIRTEWPPNPDLTPGGSPRFDAVYDSLAAGEPIREPIRVRYDNWTVIDGCHRLQSARLLGIALVPVRFWTGREWLPAVSADSTAGPDMDDPDGDDPIETFSHPYRAPIVIDGHQYFHTSDCGWPGALSPSTPAGEDTSR